MQIRHSYQVDFKDGHEADHKSWRLEECDDEKDALSKFNAVAKKHLHCVFDFAGDEVTDYHLRTVGTLRRHEQRGWFLVKVSS